MSRLFLRCALPAVAAALLVAGCGGGAAAPMSDQTRTAVLPRTPGGASAAAAGSPQGADAAAMTVSVPKEAAYTIYCADFTGPDHAAVADRVKLQSEQVSRDSKQIGRLDDFYVVQGAQRSVLYYGFYKTYDERQDKAEGLRAKRDRAALESLVNAAGDKVFPRTVFTPLDSPNPTAPPEWDLRNAKGYWTLVVCTYTKPGEAKQAAVDSVREARKQGYEAYYFFDDSQAMVCVGSFPKNAIRQQESNGDMNATVSDSYNPETVVVSNTTLDPAWKNLRDEQGRPYKLLEMRVEIQDPQMRKLYGELDYSVDGYTQGTPQRPAIAEIAKATGQPPAIDEKAIDDAAPADKNGVDKLLQRF